MQTRSITVRMSAVSLALVGMLLFSGATIALRLPRKSGEGNEGRRRFKCSMP